VAGVGRRVKFHGAFKHKSDAVAKERRTPGAFIQAKNIAGRRRYVVMTERRGR
jgi:hypothetical protein